jgi:hypothetical protein
VKLDFICIGPQRTATSWLDRVFRCHPEIQLPRFVKETFFIEKDYDKGWSWYFARYFVCNAPCILRGEIAPTLFDNSSAIASLYKHNPDMKLIAILRDPVVRSLSLFEHLVNTGRVPNDFNAATKLAPSILTASNYCKVIPLWLDKFNSNQLLLVSTDSIETDPGNTLNKITTFLGLSPLCDKPINLKERYGAAMKIRNRYIFLFVYTTAKFLRSLGMHRVVSFGRDVGLKKMFSQGGARSKLNIPENSYSMLQETFALDAQLVKNVDKYLAIAPSRDRFDNLKSP